MEKVWLLLDDDGVEAIRTQVLKLSEETCIVPEYDVLAVLVVMVLAYISSEKVTEMDEFNETEVALSAGVVLITIGVEESNFIIT